jgi:hypothetical protein
MRHARVTLTSCTLRMSLMRPAGRSSSSAEGSRHLKDRKRSWSPPTADEEENPGDIYLGFPLPRDITAQLAASEAALAAEAGASIQLRIAVATAGNCGVLLTGWLRCQTNLAQIDGTSSLTAVCSTCATGVAVFTPCHLLALTQDTWRMQGLAVPASDVHAVFMLCRCAGCFHARHQLKRRPQSIHDTLLRTITLALCICAAVMSCRSAGCLYAGQPGDKDAGGPASYICAAAPYCRTTGCIHAC